MFAEKDAFFGTGENSKGSSSAIEDLELVVDGSSSVGRVDATAINIPKPAEIAAIKLSPAKRQNRRSLRILTRGLVGPFAPCFLAGAEGAFKLGG